MKNGNSRTYLPELFSCKIRLLDDVEVSFDFKKETPGKDLLDFVCNELDLMEKDYFSLRYVDSNKQRHWLDGSKEISKQIKECKQPFMFFFRVKFYPTDPTKLGEEITRYQLYLQLKRDILHGRLLCPFNNITDLAAHVVQAEIGDYNEEEHGNKYLVTMKLLPRQNDRLEEKIMEYHKTLRGYNAAESENRFLNLARSQDLYGVDPHPCKDQDNQSLYLGLTPQGIQIIREARRVSGFVWPTVNKVSYDNKIFYIQTVSEKKKTNYAFRLNDTPSCKHLWKCTVEHMAFYSEEPIKAQGPRRSALSPQNIFRRSKYKYKFSGKTEQELKNETDRIKRANPPQFERNSSLRLSVAIETRKNCLSMPNLEKLIIPYNIPTNAIIKKENTEQAKDNEELEPSELSTENKIEDEIQKEEADCLAEFETKEFPQESDSTRSSLALDDLSSSSTQEINHITLPSPAEIRVEDTNESAQLTKADEISPVLTSTPKLADLYKNPVFLLFIIAIAMIPISVIVHMKFS